MSRPIDADAVKGLIRSGISVDTYADQDYVCELVDDIPTIDAVSEWIPCSERLPKENTEVLMSLEWGIDIGEYRNGDWHSEWINYYDDGDVLAWMPLPEPWKGADDE